MVTHCKTQGLVFKKEDRSEADRIFTLFTHDFGRIELRARAIRKITSKLRSGIEIFSVSDIGFIESSRQKTLVDAIKIEAFGNIIESPEKTEIANNVSLLLDDFIRGSEPDPALWNLLMDFFQKLDQLDTAPLNFQLLYSYFFWNFISVLGHAPELWQCAKCAKKLEPGNLSFSNKEGGVVCAHCPDKGESLKISSDAVKMLRIIIKKDWEILLKLKIEIGLQKELQKMLEHYNKYLLHSYVKK